MIYAQTEESKKENKQWTKKKDWKKGVMVAHLDIVIGHTVMNFENVIRLNLNNVESTYLGKLIERV